MNVEVIASRVSHLGCERPYVDADVRVCEEGLTHDSSDDGCRLVAFELHVLRTDDSLVGRVSGDDELPGSRGRRGEEELDDGRGADLDVEVVVAEGEGRDGGRRRGRGRLLGGGGL